MKYKKDDCCVCLTVSYSYPGCACLCHIWAEEESIAVMPRTNRQKSIQQEESAAVMTGGRRRRGSGSAPGLPGDAYGKRFLVECKFTNGHSFSIKLSDLRKIEVAAFTAGKIPLFVFGFADGDRIANEWVAFPAYLFPQVMK